MNAIYDKLKKIRPDFLIWEINKVIPHDSKTLLDIGCGENSALGRINRKNIKKIGLDVFPMAIEKSRSKKIHDEYFCCDAMEIDKIFQPKTIDCLIALDLIEHFEKSSALQLLEKMENIAKRLIVIQTPNGFFSQGEYKNNQYQVHKCGFSTKELKRMGYIVAGMDGPKFLRKKSFEETDPGILFSIIANILDPIYRFIPDKSFNLLAYKYIDG